MAAYRTGKTSKENKTEILVEVKAELELPNRRGNVKRDKGLEFYLLGSSIRLPNGGTSYALTKLCWREELLRKGVVLQSKGRMETKRLKWVFGAPYGLALRPNR